MCTIQTKSVNDNTWLCIRKCCHYAICVANRKFPVLQNHTQLSTRSVLGGHELEVTAPLLLNLFWKEVDLFKAAPCLPTVDWAVIVDQHFSASSSEGKWWEFLWATRGRGRREGRRREVMRGNGRLLFYHVIHHSHTSCLCMYIKHISTLQKNNELNKVLDKLTYKLKMFII